MCVVPEQRRKSAYHHGALREELVSACLSLIEAEGIQAVSLRRVAREAGVSTAAPYHHFADRAALLGLLSLRGFDELTKRLRVVVAEEPRPPQALARLIETYVQFASEHRAYFQLMFRPELTGLDKTEEVHAAGEVAFGIVTQVVGDWQRTGLAPAGELEPLAALIWAVGHGLAALSLDGSLDKRADKAGLGTAELTRAVARILENLFDTGQRRE